MLCRHIGQPLEYFNFTPSRYYSSRPGIEPQGYAVLLVPEEKFNHKLDQIWRSF